MFVIATCTWKGWNKGGFGVSMNYRTHNYSILRLFIMLRTDIIVFGFRTLKRKKTDQKRVGLAYQHGSDFHNTHQ